LRIKLTKIQGSARHGINEKELNMDSGQTLALAVQHHQAGNLSEAEGLYRRVLQAEPRNPDALHLLGVIAHQVGRNEAAIDLIRSALGERPTMAAAHCNLGAALQATGQLDQAVASFRRALQLKPDYVEAYNNLGNALQNQGMLAEAVAVLQQALRLRPGDAVALTNLGSALHKLGRVEEAITHHQEAVRRQPTFADAHNNLGSVLHEQGKLDEAAASYEQALRLNANHVDALTNLGLIRLAQGKVEDAIACQERAVRANPSHPAAHNNLGVALVQRGRLNEAAASYAQAVRLKPGYLEAHRNLGSLRMSQGKLDEALACYEQAVRLLPDSPPAHCELGKVLQELGRFDAAEQSFRTALRLDPGHAEALWGLTIQKRDKMTEPDRASLEHRLTEPDLKDADRSLIHFSLAQLCDAKGEYGPASAHLRQANALSLATRRQRGKVHDRDNDARVIEQMIDSFTPAFFERVRGFGLDTERPVFIVGLPRSGTTLTDQILAAHSHVFSAGELFLAHQDFHALGTPASGPNPFAALPALDRDTVRRLAQWHLDQLAALNSTAERIVSKMPDNYFYLGLLAVLFPKAKYIHCRRDLRDVALSCWMNPLANDWSNDFAHIADRFRNYQRLMNHWRAVLPVSMLEISYEETVADLPSVARRLVEWCGLDWEPACVKFNEGIRPVRTASMVQVREPIYTRSIGRWQHYERELSELFAALDLSPERGF
jgi:tetratricopeptide (TPR) repeat protein